MDENRAHALRFFCQYARRASVDGFRHVELSLGAIHVGVSRRVDDHLGPEIAQCGHQRIGVGKIESFAIQRRDIAMCRQDSRKLESELACGSRH